MWWSLLSIEYVLFLYADHFCLFQDLSWHWWLNTGIFSLYLEISKFHGSTSPVLWDYTWWACVVVGYLVYLALHVIPISGKHHGYLSCLFWCYMVEKYYCKGLFPGTLVKFHGSVMSYWIRIYTVVLLLLGKKMVKNTDVMRWLYTHIYKQPKSWAIWNNCNYQ